MFYEGKRIYPIPDQIQIPCLHPQIERYFFFLFVVLLFFFAVACAEQEVLTMNASDKTTDALNFKKIAIKAVM